MTDLSPLVVRTPVDLLALVPTRLGFHPRDSLVLLTVGDAGRPFHARADLPRGAAERQGLVRHLVEVAARCDVTAVAVVVYAEHSWDGEPAAVALADALVHRGVQVLCAVRADGDRWWLLDEDGPGEPYDLRVHPFVLQAVVDGQVVLPSREALAAGLRGDDRAEQDRVAGWSGPVADPAWCRERVRRFLDDGVRLDTEDLARLVHGCADPGARRAVTALVGLGRRADRHVDLWRDVVRRSPRGRRDWPAALLAQAAYLAGDGALAWCAVEVSQDAQPDNVLAAVLTQALVAGVPPSVWPGPGSGSGPH